MVKMLSKKQNKLNVMAVTIKKVLLKIWWRIYSFTGNVLEYTIAWII